MGLILRFGPHPTPLHVADNSLSAFVDVDVFDGDCTDRAEARVENLKATIAGLLDHLALSEL